MNLDPAQMRQTSPPANLVQDLLHAIGQPLTSLQMCVLLRDHPSLDYHGSSTLMHDMADEVILLSRLFGTLRRVLDSGGESACTAAAELALRLPGCLPHWQQAALQRDIRILVTGIELSRQAGPHPAPPGLIEACLEDIVAAALESAPDRGSITIALFPPSAANPSRLHITGGNLLSEISFSSRFALPAAKALLNSNDQVLTYSANPFQATLVLRAPASPVSETDLIDRSPPVGGCFTESGLGG